MSIRCRVRIVHKFLLILISTFLAGTAAHCPLCCILRRRDLFLNCTWTGDVVTQYTLRLESLKYNANSPPLIYTPSLGQNWLLIPRENLTLYDHYHLRLQGGDTEEDYYFTYGKDGEKLLIEPPVLPPVTFLEDNIVEVRWLYPPDVSHQDVELQYRKLGEDDWIPADPSDLSHGTYEIYDLEPSSVYEVQVRYLPDELQKMGSLWSEPLTFQTAEEAPTEPLDVWLNSERIGSVSLLWKVPKNHERSHLWNYTVTYARNGESYSEERLCREDLRPCEAFLPPDAADMCVRARNTGGTGPPACAPSLCLDQKPVDLEIKAWSNANNHSITVWWDEPANPPCENITYLAEWTELAKGGNVIMNWTRSQVANRSLALQGKLAPRVPYRVSLFILCQSDCNGSISTIIYSEEGVPFSAPHFSVKPLSSTAAFIAWGEISIWHRQGILTHYNVYVNSTAGSQHHKVSGSNISISGLLPETLYEVWVTASTIAGEGPPGDVNAFHTTGPTPLYLKLLPMYFILVMLGVLILIYSQWKWGRKCWIKVPTPKTSRTLALLYHTGYSNNWDSMQVILAPLRARLCINSGDPKPRSPRSLLM
uniref:Fibronectin type-III domain-containing protein n=1 Tax=Leptobrachium leishanense TaxID=445787 RepID=A0A8C5N234_9ANUR